MVEPLSGVDVDRSGRSFLAPIQLEHEFDTFLAKRPVVIGALLEAATHGVVVDEEVEDFGEEGQKVVAIAAAPKDEQPLRLRAFEFADSLLVAPHPIVVMKGPAWKASVGVNVIGPSAVGTDGVVAASDQLVIHRGLSGTRQALHQVVPLRPEDSPV